jgi:hypothetical protein
VIVKPTGRMTAIDYGIHAVQIAIGLTLLVWLSGTDLRTIVAKLAAIF